VFWTQYLRLRTKLDELPPDLGEEIVRLARQIEQAPQRFKRRSSSYNSRKDDDAEVAAVTANRQLALRFTSLVKEAHSLPGVERLLLNETYPMLSPAGERCPVVVLLASNACCAAILMRKPGMSAEHVPLTDITVEQIQKLATMMQDATQGVRNTRDGRAMR
jgi:hypothetical protein